MGLNALTFTGSHGWSQKWTQTHFCSHSKIPRDIVDLKKKKKKFHIDLQRLCGEKKKSSSCCFAGTDKDIWILLERKCQNWCARELWWHFPLVFIQGKTVFNHLHKFWNKTVKLGMRCKRMKIDTQLFSIFEKRQRCAVSMEKKKISVIK